MSLGWEVKLDFQWGAPGERRDDNLRLLPDLVIRLLDLAGICRSFYLFHLCNFRLQLLYHFCHLSKINSQFHMVTFQLFNFFGEILNTLYLLLILLILYKFKCFFVLFHKTVCSLDFLHKIWPISLKVVMSISFLAPWLAFELELVELSDEACDIVVPEVFGEDKTYEAGYILDLYGIPFGVPSHNVVALRIIEQILQFWNKLLWFYHFFD